MIRRFILRGLAVVLAACVLLVLALIATWSWRGGLEGALAAAVRMARHPVPTVTDHRHQPSRVLAASATPRKFTSSRPDLAPPPLVDGGGGRRMPLQQLIATSGTLAFVVIRNDSVVYERYATEHGGVGVSHYQEITEAIVGTLVGMALDDGLLHAVDDPVTAQVPELAGRGFAKLTLRQLLDGNVAVDSADGADGIDPFGLQALMDHTTQLEALIVGLRPSEGDGARFDHRAGRSALLSLVLQRALQGESLTAYAQRRLWSPLGMEQPGLWSLDREGGMEKAWCCIAGTARDLAKIGRLQLQRGVAGKADRFGWRPASPAGVDTMAVGADGQFLYVDPRRNTIVVRLGKRLGPLSQAQWAAIFAALSAHAW